MSTEDHTYPVAGCQACKAAGRPMALCCCGTPLVGTFEMRGKEWYCVTCEAFYEWLHARKGNDHNPTPELDARYDAAKAQYDAERATRVKP